MCVYIYALLFHFALAETYKKREIQNSHYLKKKGTDYCSSEELKNPTNFFKKLQMISKKKFKISSQISQKSDLFYGLPDDLVICILSKLSSTASCPSDFISILITCKRLNQLGLHPLVLSTAGAKTFAVKANNWSESCHRFLKKCVVAGNIEACYFLGMIRFYCLQNRGTGASLMAKAAIKSHALALYSLAVIQFNGSGSLKTDKDLRAGVALAARAAYLGNIDALRELGHCLQDGYGVAKNITEGRRLLVQANARELAIGIRAAWPELGLNISARSLLSDFGCNVPAREVHPVNRFLREWFELARGALGQGLRLCSYGGCGRPETRVHEFRRCSICGTVNYCSRGCQALDWKVRHKVNCGPVELWLGGGGDGGGDGGVGGMVEVEEVENVAS